MPLPPNATGAQRWAYMLKSVETLNGTTDNLQKTADTAAKQNGDLQGRVNTMQETLTAVLQRISELEGQLSRKRSHDDVEEDSTTESDESVTKITNQDVDKLKDNALLVC